MMLEEPGLDWRERDSANDCSLFGHCRCWSRTHNTCQLRDRLVLKKLARLEIQTCLLRSRRDLNAENRIAAQIEEIGVSSYLPNAEHAGPDVLERLLDYSLRA